MDVLLLFTVWNPILDLRRVPACERVCDCKGGFFRFEWFGDLQSCCQGFSKSITSHSFRKAEYFPPACIDLQRIVCSLVLPSFIALPFTSHSPTSQLEAQCSLLRRSGRADQSLHRLVSFIVSLASITLKSEIALYLLLHSLQIFPRSLE